MLKRKLMLPILAVIVGIAASAFTTANTNYQTNHNSTSRAGEEWFVYNGGSISDPDSYSLYTPDPENGPSCEGSSELCAIKAQASQSDPMRPDLSTQVDDKHKN